MGRANPDLPGDARHLEETRESLTEEVWQLNSERDVHWDRLSVLRPWYTVEERREEMDPSVLEILRSLDALEERVERCWARLEEMQQRLLGQNVVKG